MASIRSALTRTLPEGCGAITDLDDAPDEDIAADEKEWKQVLLEQMLEMAPDAFERLAQRLLREAGFRNVEVLGRSGDGGIDGVGVYRLSLVSFPVYFQCSSDGTRVVTLVAAIEVGMTRYVRVAGRGTIWASAGPYRVERRLDDAYRVVPGNG